MARQQVSKWGFVGMGGLACVLFLDIGTAGIAPWWVTTLLVLFWLVLLAIGARWFEPHPGRVPWLAVLSFAVWLPTIVLGTTPAGLGPLTAAGQGRGADPQHRVAAGTVGRRHEQVTAGTLGHRAQPAVPGQGRRGPDPLEVARGVEPHEHHPRGLQRGHGEGALVGPPPRPLAPR